MRITHKVEDVLDVLEGQEEHRAVSWVAYTTGQGDSTARAILERLHAHGYVQKLHGRGHATSYRLTESGEELARSVLVPFGQ
jgi:DNA-binding IclR family transcriptional regulator